MQGTGRPVLSMSNGTSMMKTYLPKLWLEMAFYSQTTLNMNWAKVTTDEKSIYKNPLFEEAVPLS